MTIITLPKILRDKLTDEGADAIVQILDKIEERSQNVILEIAEERFEKRLAQLDAKIDTVEAKLEAKITSVEAKLEAKITSVEAKLEAKLASVEAKLQTEIVSNKAEIIKWMFIFWVGQVAVLTGIMFAFFRK